MKDLYQWEVKNNFPDADFWLTNKGSADTLGSVTREFKECLTGIKCPAIILPDYGYYLCCYLHSSGVWKKHAQGSISWQHLRITDVRQVFKEIGRAHQAEFKLRTKYIPVKTVKKEAEETEAEETGAADQPLAA